jgi:putative transposase
VTDHIDLLRAAFRRVRARYPFAIEAAVISPDHLHVIWTLPDGDADFATRWRLIKSGFSHRLPRGERISASRAAKGERGIWQRRYWEHTLRDQDDLIRHLDYIHFNPVKHTGTRHECKTGPIPRFAAGSGSTPIRWIGQAIPARRHVPSAKDDGFRFRSTHPTF